MRLALRRAAALCLLGLAAACSNSAMYDFNTEGLIAPDTACAADPQKLGHAVKIPDFSEGAGCQVGNAWHIYSLAHIQFYAADQLPISWPATLNCGMVSPLNDWLTGTVQPAARAAYGENVVAVRVGAYSCRAINGESGAKMSEHGFGNALDVSAFVLESGRKVTVLDGWYGSSRDRDFLRRVHGEACGKFSTVLGPEDPHHHDHFHLDRQVRPDGNVCQ